MAVWFEAVGKLTNISNLTAVHKSKGLDNPQLVFYNNQGHSTISFDNVELRDKAYEGICQGISQQNFYAKVEVKMVEE